jgi:hypothetical protein
MSLGPMRAESAPTLGIATTSGVVDHNRLRVRAVREVYERFMEDVSRASWERDLLVAMPDAIATQR